ncbi:MAG: TraR/DksA C4-type zinc finger protein [Patescibacteria group bacterium]|nr:TraR/DksA C4-type zinc finger protein [Patescibacteria group bacterium]
MKKVEKLQKIKRKLITQRKYIADQLKKFARKNKKIKDDYETEFPHLGDHQDENAIEVSDYENNLSVEHNLEEELENIGDALKKTSEGTYGICSNCGRPINPKRLEALPEATLCIECSKKKHK